MTDWIDPKRWLILQYRPGTGGKFLCSAMMTLQAVYHWDPDVESGQKSHEQWLQQFWQPDDATKWISHEPTIHWHTDFYSRSRDRGDDIDLGTYQTIMQTSCPGWYQRAWRSGKILLDWLNKNRVPPWLHGSTLVRLDVRDRYQPRYIEILEKKLFPYDDATGFGTVMMDSPDASQLNPNFSKYQNPYQFGPFRSKSQWFEWLWQNYQPLNWYMSPAHIYFEDLCDFAAVDHLISSLAQVLSCTYNRDALRFTHDYWTACHRHLLDLPSA